MTTLRSRLCYSKSVSVCRLSVASVHPTQRVEAFGNISLLCTLPILWPLCKIYARNKEKRFS